MRHVLKAIAVGSLVTACARDEVGAGEAASRTVEHAPERAPEVLYAGCESVTAGPVCRLRPGAPLRLWVAVHPEAPLTATRDGAALAARWTPAEDGLRAELRPAPGLVTVAAADAGWRWSLQVEPAQAMPAELAAVAASSEAGEPTQALELLDAQLPALRGAARAEGLKLRGDLEFQRGAHAAALAAYEAAFAAALAEGLLARASEVSLIATFLCTTQTHEFALARRWLARHEALIDRLPEARLRHGYYAGLLADRTGDYNEALRRYSEHARLARALGQAHDVAAALSGLGVLLGRLGDAAGAEAAFAEALALGDQVPAGERALLLQNSAWVALEARARGHDAPDPAPRLAEVLAIFGPDGSHPDRSIAADTLLNSAFAAVLRGDQEAAAAALARVAATDRRTARWRLYLEARLEALAGRHAAALRRFTALAARARDDDDRGLEWSAEIGAGAALVAGGEPEAALARFRGAALLHRADVGALAVDLGRSRFAAERDDGARGLVALLLQLGRVDEAMCAARQARAHAFADLAAMTRDPAALAAHREARSALEAALEATWDLPRRRGELERARLRGERVRLDARLDAALRGDRSDRTGAKGQVSGADPTGCAGLREPAPGELLLVYFALERGHAGFAVDAGGVVAAELAGELPAAPADRAELLLGRFDAAIARARQVSIVASGRLAGAAFHALPWRGAPLIAARPVAYALDLLRPPAPPHGLTRAVQLVPPSNLARADEEAAAVARILGARQVAVTRLRGSEPALQVELAGADLLHFVGHARGDGWGGALDLGGDRSLGAGDLLTAPAPGIAVLSGCETGLHDPRAHAGGMSLAHALLLAGASAVIAADTRISDDLAAALVPLAMTAIADGQDAAGALRAAQDRLRGERDDWSQFRVFIP